MQIGRTNQALEVLDTKSDEIIEDLIRATLARASTGDPTSIKNAYAEIIRSINPDQSDHIWKNGLDILGQAYMKILSSSARRVNGQVFTPPWAAEFMTKWVMRSKPKDVLDPGCGSGVLLLAALEARCSHARFIGIDKDPIAVLMTQKNVELHGFRADVRLNDFLIDDIKDRPSAIVCNPPYTRHHFLTSNEKDQIASTIGQRLGLRRTRSASLHALFLARALEIASDGAHLAFITPAQWLDTAYGREVKNFLEEVAHISAVIELDPDFFPHASTSAAITLIVKAPANGRSPQMFRIGRRLPKPDDMLQELAKRASLSQKAVTKDRRLRGRIKLGELAVVHRGVATGHNKFFVLSDAERRTRCLSKTYLRPCIASPRYFDGTKLTSAIIEGLSDELPRWLLVARKHRDKGPLSDYLKHGRQIKVDERYLARHRSPWFSITFKDTFPILFTYLNQRNPRFVRNISGAVPLNTWLVIEPRKGIDPDELFNALTDPVVVQLASQRGRHYGHGLWKLEPSEVENLLVAWPHASNP